MAIQRRHTEWFGPDFARGPVLSGAPEVAAVQMAANLAQLRVPLVRSDSELTAHADFIRSLADRLFPDLAGPVVLSVGSEQNNQITTQITDNSGAYSLVQMWLADSVGGGETATAPDSVSFSGAVVLETITPNKRFLVITPKTGLANVTVSYAGSGVWYWAAARQGRVVYSTKLDFRVP